MSFSFSFPRPIDAGRQLLKAPRSSSYSAASKEGQGKTLPPSLRREDGKKTLPPSLRTPRRGAGEGCRNPSDLTQPQSSAAISPKARRRKPQGPRGSAAFLTTAGAPVAASPSSSRVRAAAGPAPARQLCQAQGCQKAAPARQHHQLRAKPPPQHFHRSPALVFPGNPPGAFLYPSPAVLSVNLFSSSKDWPRGLLPARVKAWPWLCGWGKKSPLW